MSIKFKTFFSALSILVFFSTSCQQQVERSPQPKSKDNALLMAVLYNYYAAEYKALCYQAFNIGKERLLEIKANNLSNPSLAVVVDIDETILDNSPPEAKLILDNKTYNDEDWNNWCAMATAETVPGSLDFLNFADSLGYTIFYVSNRKDKFTRQGTIENLANQGFPQLADENILLRTDERDKERRRQLISEKYQIVLLVGDNIGDFYRDTTNFIEREKTMLANKSEFGRKYLVLPNPMYGDWAKAIQLFKTEKNVDSLLNLMVKRHFTLLN